MHLGADMMRNKPHNAFAVTRRQTLAGIDQSTGQPIDPEPAVGVEHYLDDCGILQPERNTRTKCCAQHARATRRRLLIEMVDSHLCPPNITDQLWRPRVAVVMLGMIRRGRRRACATRSDQA